MEEETSTLSTCEICVEPLLPSSTTKLNNENRCVHQFCTDCMIKFIQVKVDDNVPHVRCPGLNCQQMLDPLSCMPVLPPELFIKWCDVLCNSAVLGFERCYCPNRDCSALVLNECGGKVKKTECPACKKLFCFKCKTPWHSGFRCKESGRIRDKNDVMFGVLMETEKLKRCPRCGYCIQRIAGCMDLQCRCGTEFCYLCGKANDGEIDCDCERVAAAIRRCCTCCCICFFIICILVVILCFVFKLKL